MLSKPKLLNYIKELKQLVAGNSLQSVQNIICCLEQTINELESNKLNVYVLSANITLAESFRQRFNSYPTLDSIYQFQSHELAKREVEESKAISSAFLVLQEQSGVTQHYALSTAPILTVGRQPGCNFHIPDHHTRVSGQHLEVHFCPMSDRNSAHQWRVKNSDRCRNGTYINGKLLIEDHILKAGDRLVLGDCAPSAYSPELLFEHSIALESVQPERHFSFDCCRGCTVFLVVDSRQEFSEEEKLVLELVNSSNVFLVTFPEQTIEAVNNSQQSSSSIELEILCQQMETISAKHIAECKIQNAAHQTIFWTSSLEKVLLAEQESIAQQIEGIEKQRSQNKARQNSVDSSALMKKIAEHRMSLSESVDGGLEQAKQDLLDDSLVSSILHRLSDEIDRMEAQIVKQDKKKFLKLGVENCDSNVNDYLMQFCQGELLDWAEMEWEKICSEYGDGGLENLVIRSQSLLESSRTSSRHFAPPIDEAIDLQSIFQVSLRKIPDRVEYQPTSIFLFSIKKIRSSVFQVMSILFLLSFLGLSRGSFIRSINKQITISTFLICLALGVILWLFYRLYRSYQHDKKMEMQKVADKIRLDLKGYYQKTVKARFAEKLARMLKAAFKEKLHRFEKELKFHFEGMENQEGSTVDRPNPDLHLKEHKVQLRQVDDRLRSLRAIRDKVHRMLEK